MKLIRGYEKAWNALLMGGMVTAVTTLAIWVTSLSGAVSPPTEADIKAAVVGIIAALAAAAGAFIATNSAPTTEDPNGTQIGVPMPVVPAQTTTVLETPQ